MSVLLLFVDATTWAYLFGWRNIGKKLDSTASLAVFDALGLPADKIRSRVARRRGVPAESLDSR